MKYPTLVLIALFSLAIQAAIYNLAMQVNAKNGYGGYGDSKPLNCF